MSIKWTQDEEDFIWELMAEEDAEYTYFDMAKLLYDEIGFVYRSAEAIRKFVSRQEPSYYDDTEIRDTIKLGPKTTGPKILIFDTEILPIKTYTWGIWKQNISDYQIIKDWCLLAWSAKWLNDSTTYGNILTSAEALARNDKRICETLYKLVDEADILVAYNGDAFDIKKINSRFFLHKMPPPSPYRTIDPLKQSRKHFGFTSNKLNYISQLISNKEKLKTGFDLWVACDNGEQWALDKMFDYNQYDTVLLEEAFIEMLPWMTGIPNFALYTEMEKPVCSYCGHHQLEENGFYVTSASKYQSYRCEKCGGYSRSRLSSVTRIQRENLLINPAE